MSTQRRNGANVNFDERDEDEDGEEMEKREGECCDEPSLRVTRSGPRRLSEHTASPARDLHREKQRSREAEQLCKRGLFCFRIAVSKPKPGKPRNEGRSVFLLRRRERSTRRRRTMF